MSARTVRYLASIGELPGSKVGRAWRFWRAEILEYVERRQRTIPKTRTLLEEALLHYPLFSSAYAKGAGQGTGVGAFFGVNPAGEITGYSVDANGVYHGFLRLADDER